MLQIMPRRCNYPLLLSIGDRFNAAAKFPAASVSYFHKYDSLAVKHDEVDLSASETVILAHGLETAGLEEITRDAFRPAASNEGILFRLHSHWVGWLSRLGTPFSNLAHSKRRSIRFSASTDRAPVAPAYSM